MHGDLFNQDCFSEHQMGALLSVPVPLEGVKSREIEL